MLFNFLIQYNEFYKYLNYNLLLSIDNTHDNYNIINVKTKEITGEFKKYNHNKLESWVSILNRKDSYNKNFILLDADILIKENLEHVFNDSFDICYTVDPLNSGVLFIRNNNNTIKFFNTWLKQSEYYLNNIAEYIKLNQKYPGFIQTSFGYLLDNYKEDIELKKLPCSIYNACNKEYWDNNKYKILHLRPPLRKEYVSK